MTADTFARILVGLWSFSLLVTGICGVRKREITIGAKGFYEVKKGESAVTWGVIYVMFGLVVLWALFLGGAEVIYNLFYEYIRIVLKTASVLDLH